MVTFISQCEKNALKKTRRVLDAFANRIGDNTWQTLITEDGLQTVKKMLRQTASKSTAVSCHWIRTRARSQFLWVVGNKGKFNSEGVVPVNSTQVIVVKMDDKKMNNEIAYANTKKQPLEQHLFAVGYVASQLIKKLNIVNGDGDENQKLAKAVFVAGCLHDIGKLDPEFQSWLAKLLTKKKIDDELLDDGLHIDKGKFSFEKHPRHNELSLLMYHLVNDEGFIGINRTHKDMIKHVIFWHHAKPFRKEEFRHLEVVYKKFSKNLEGIKFQDFYYQIRQLIKSVNVLADQYGEVYSVEGIEKVLDEDRIYDLKKEIMPQYKIYSLNHDEVHDYVKDISLNSHQNIARTVVISADRLVSALSCNELGQHIKNKTLDTLLDNILTNDSKLRLSLQTSLDSFETKYVNSERNIKQSIAAEKLLEVGGVAVLNGPAGCGKTKIALEWAAKSGVNKIIWVCPRVQVCQGLFKDLTDKDSEQRLLNANVEINTGEFKFINGFDKETPEEQEFTGDIVITTIDQIINAITTHKNVTKLVEFMSAHVVFDEFHEYINMPAFNVLFAELVRVKGQQKDSRCLLVSATPNYYFTEFVLEIDSDDIVGIDSFNESLYRLSFPSFDETLKDETNPLFQQQLNQKSTFVISNTAITAQLSFIQHQAHENAILLHSKFKKLDKLDLFERTFSAFKRGGNLQYNILRSGPIVQAALNISCDYMVTEFTLAENFLQRLGRLDRFGLNSEENNYVMAVPQSINEGKNNGASAKFLGRMFSLQSAKAWYAFLQDNLVKEANVYQAISIGEIYKLYKSFYETNIAKEAVAQDLLLVLKKSAQVIDAQVHDPVSMPNKKLPKDGTIKIKKNSLRGNNRFVQMAVGNISNKGELEFIEQYAYDESNNDDGLTASVEQIYGYGNSDQNLLAFMMKKHHNIKDTKKLFNDYAYLNEARSTGKPIYLSYTPNDLKIVEAQPHNNAIYYVMGSKQAIGICSINALEKMNND
jgi:CRISPR-associated endonuclease/helicase Cas3